MYPDSSLQSHTSQCRLFLAKKSITVCCKNLSHLIFELLSVLAINFLFVVGNKPYHKTKIKQIKLWPYVFQKRNILFASVRSTWNFLCIFPIYCTPNCFITSFLLFNV